MINIKSSHYEGDDGDDAAGSMAMEMRPSLFSLASPRRVHLHFLSPFYFQDTAIHARRRH